MKPRARKQKAVKREDTWDLLKTSWRFQTREFFDKSTLHGVRYIAEKDRPFSERFIWFCLTSVGTIVTLIIIASLWEKFQTNPTITGLDTDFHDWEVPFPSITLCPDNPANSSLVQELVYSTWGNSSDVEYYSEFVKTISLLTISNIKNILQYSKDHSKYRLPETNFEEIQLKLVSDCSEVIFNCEWKGSPYNCCEGFSGVLTEVGFCYTFNSMHSKSDKDGLRITSKAVEFKPQLIYETDSKWSIVVNMSNVKENNVRVYIHSAEELPSADMAPQHLWRGTIKKIDFSVKHTYTTDEVRSLSIKQRHCVFPQEIKLLTDTNYTYTVCMMECRMKRAKALCGCVPFFYKELENFPHCNLDGLACLAKQNVDMKQEMSCSCELGCMNTVYEVDKLTDALTFEYPLEIGFVSWPMVRYKREVLFGWVDLLVSFGGIAGLFLGFSLLSGVELVYYFTMRSFCMLHRNRDELRRLKYEYETRPRPDFDLELKPYFMRSAKVKPITEQIQAGNKVQMFNIPYLN